MKLFTDWFLLRGVLLLDVRNVDDLSSKDLDLCLQNFIPSVRKVNIYYGMYYSFI